MKERTPQILYLEPLRSGSSATLESEYSRVVSFARAVEIGPATTVLLTPRSQQLEMASADV